jgi:hypothetical protein
MWYSPEHAVVVGAFASLSLLAPTTPPYGVGGGRPTTSCDAPAPSLPSSIAIEKGLERVVQWTLENSPTFRQQCRVLAGATMLTATVRVEARTPGATERALSTVRRTPSGVLSAEIRIWNADSLSELLGHEFEHLIEQLDGVNLAALVNSGQARRMDGGAFETARAVAAGQRVSGEVLDRAPDGVKRAAGRVWRALSRGARR